MTIFQNELNNLLGRNNLLTEQKFTGNVLFGKLSDNTVLKAEIVTNGVADNYSTIRLQAINIYDGVIDSTLIHFKDIIQRNDSRGAYIWTYNGKSEWYGPKPSASEYKALREHINNYIETFSDLEPTQDVGMKMGM